MILGIQGLWRGSKILPYAEVMCIKSIDIGQWPMKSSNSCKEDQVKQTVS